MPLTLFWQIPPISNFQSLFTWPLTAFFDTADQFLLETLISLGLSDSIPPDFASLFLITSSQSLFWLSLPLLNPHVDLYESLALS